MGIIFCANVFRGHVSYHKPSIFMHWLTFYYMAGVSVDLLHKKTKRLRDMILSSDQLSEETSDCLLFTKPSLYSEQSFSFYNGSLVVVMRKIIFLRELY